MEPITASSNNPPPHHSRWLLIILLFILAAVSSYAAWTWHNQATQPAVQPQPTPTPFRASGPSPILALELITNNLPKVTSIAHIPGDPRLYITQQLGVIRVIKDQQVQPTPLLDISPKVRGGGELGLLGLVFDPHFSQNHFFYVHYSRPDMASVIARFTANSDATAADPATEKIILIQPQPFENHNGGHLAFGPDGYLYIGFGDGGSGGDPLNNGQKSDTWLGKMLRIDVHRGDPYQVPSDNPFVSTARFKPEIWDLGLRNPWKFSFDRKNGRLIIADVGQGHYEEIHVAAKGKGGHNYGWRCYEGNHTFNLTGCQSAAHYTPAVLEYSHTAGRCSVTGGYVYRGQAVPAWTGRYLYGDLCTGEIWSMVLGQPTQTHKLELDNDLSIASFGEDATGELYVHDYRTGRLFRLIGAQ